MNQQVLATVAGREITQADFNAFIQTIPPEQQAYLQNPAARDYYLEQLISIYLFAQMGEDEKLDETPEFHELLEKAKRDILSQMAMYQILKDIKVTDEEVKAYFDAHQDQYVKGDKVRAKHILMDSEEQISKVLEQINQGEISFEDAAKEHSTCPSGQQGGDLGEFGKGQMVKEFEDAAFTGGIDAVTGPVKTQFGYHLIKVMSRTESVPASLEESTANIRSSLMQQKQQEAYNAKVAELKEKYCK